MNNTVMIVDDLKLNIALLAQCLGDQYMLMPATSGEMAIKMLEKKKPDLILLDILMPGIDGFGVLEHMKADENLSDIPVIFVTGEHDASLEEKGINLGAADYIRKPYNMSVVSAKVKNYLELKNYRDNLQKLVAERTEQLERSAAEHASMSGAMIMGMSIVSESRDKLTSGHTSRIKQIVRMLAGKMCEKYPEMVTEEAANRITMFSPLHDIGNTSVSDVILNKPGRLTEKEFEIMKTHTTEGARILKMTEGFLHEGHTSDLNTAAEIAQYHHEKYDGTGYPNGLEGEDIPVSARIVSIADVYDALRSARPYKRALSHEEAVKIISDGDEKTNNKQFDPCVMDVFMELEKELEKELEAEY